MDTAFYFEVLYPFQDRVLKVVNELETGFYLGGGTAASRGYLNHRFSDDLDLFVDDDDRFTLWAGRVTRSLLGRLDSPENILANKIAALLDREEPKDLADVWGFCHLMNLSLSDALTGAQGKAAGVFPLDLARVLLSATVADWEQIRWVDAPSANRFVADLHTLGESLILLQ